jgi:PKD repeat protein
MKKITLSTIAILTGLFSQAQIFSGLYPFDSVKATTGITDPTPVPTATGVTFGSFSATGTPANPNATARFSFTDWATGAAAGETVYANLTGSVNTAEYYEVTIAPAAGYTISLTDITFSFGRSGTGVRTYSVRSDADAYAANLPASISPANVNLSVQSGDVFFLNTDITTTSQNGSTITLSGASFTNLSGPRTFRFYGWNSEATTGTFSIDNVTINGTAMLPAMLTANFSGTNVCFGDSTEFTDMSTGPNPIISWAWDFGTATGVSTMQNPSYMYMGYGMYTVTLTVTDIMLNTDTHTDTVWVYSKPEADFSSPLTNCGGPVQFYDSSSVTGGTITEWMWNFGDPASGVNDTSTMQDPMHTFSGSGTYTVTQIVSSNYGCADTTSAMITNSSNLTANLSASTPVNTTIFSGSATGGSGPYSYLLDFGDGTFSTNPNDFHLYMEDSTYTACLTVTDSIGCVDSSCTTFLVDTGVGIDVISNITSVSVTPNPSSDGMFTLTAQNVANMNITVYNILGKKIFSKQLSEGRHTIDLSAEAKGSYFVTIQTENEVITKKIVISK